MDLTDTEYQNILHSVVQDFMTCVKEYFPQEVLDNDRNMEKVRCELAKRSDFIAAELRRIAAYKYIESRMNKRGLIDPDDISIFTNFSMEYTEAIMNIIPKIFAEDSYCLPSNRNESFKITYDQLHNRLYKNAARDITNLTMSSMNMEEQNTEFWINHFSDLSIGPAYLNQKFPQTSMDCYLSSQLANDAKQLDVEILELRKIFEENISDVRMNNNDPITKINDYLKNQQESTSEDTTLEFSDKHRCKTLSASNGMKHANLEDISLESMDGTPDSPTCVINEEDNLTGYDKSSSSWESLFWTKDQIEHSFLESSNDFDLYWSEKISHVHSSTANVPDPTSEGDMVHNILDVLIGIPSDIFLLDCDFRKFRMKFGVHLPNMSSESTNAIVSTFVDSGSMFNALTEFSSDMYSLSKGSVYNGMVHGIQKVLTLYKEHITAIKANSPSMLFLRSNVIEIADFLWNFGIICGVNPEIMKMKDIPRGLGLLTYLNNIAKCHKGTENAVMIAVLLKYSYEPFLGFLNQWIFEGTCDDFFGEFHIEENSHFLQHLDSSYWLHGYTENKGDSHRALPVELSEFAKRILDCGKNVNLLKKICNEFCSHSYLLLKSSEILDLRFSIPNVANIVRKSVEFSEENPDKVISDTTELSVENQTPVKNTSVLEHNTTKSFIDTLASLLVSGNEGVCDILSSIEGMPFQHLLKVNFAPIINSRISAVEAAVTNSILNKYGLVSTISGLWNIYIFQDTMFAETLCNELFPQVRKSGMLKELYFNKILDNAISSSNFDYNCMFSPSTFSCESSDMHLKELNFLDFFKIAVDIKPPLNIIIDPACIVLYSRIFSMLLKIEFLLWLLLKARDHLTEKCKVLDLHSNRWFRMLMINEYEMHNFIRNIRNGIHQHLHGPLWEHLTKDLTTQECSVDDLSNIHMKYLKQALRWCFLFDDSSSQQESLSGLVNNVYEFCNVILHYKWETQALTQFDRFSLLVNTFKDYRIKFVRCRKILSSYTIIKDHDDAYHDFVNVLFKLNAFESLKEEDI